MSFHHEQPARFCQARISKFLTGMPPANFLFVMQNPLSKEARYAVLKAALLKPTNLLVLAGGCLAAKFSFMLSPAGIMAYGILCYLDVSNGDFVKKILSSTRHAEPLPKNTMPPADSAETLAPELRQLRQQIAAMNQKIAACYRQADDFTRLLIGDLSQIEEIAAKSERFICKAQQIADYLASADETQIQQGIESLEATLRQTTDEFSRSQYQQALEHRHTHLQTVRALQRIYERLRSQLTNIEIAFESMYSRIVKLNSTDATLSEAESQAAAAQLQRMLRDMAQLDAAMNAQLALHAP